MTHLYTEDVGTWFLRNVLIICRTSERKANSTFVVPAEVWRDDAWKSYGKERDLRHSMALFFLDLAMCKKREEALVMKISPLLCLMVQFESVRRRWCGRCWGSINDGIFKNVITLFRHGGCCAWQVPEHRTSHFANNVFCLVLTITGTPGTPTFITTWSLPYESSVFFLR